MRAAAAAAAAGEVASMALVKDSAMPCGVDVMDAVHGRRAVRDYTLRGVSRDVVSRLLDAAVQAPSAMNRQPWAFVVVQDVALLRRISERSRELALREAQPRGPLETLRHALSDPRWDAFHGARTLIVVCAEPDEHWPSAEDCCLAAQNLMLAAHGLGLGTCPIGLARAALNEPELKTELGIPPDHRAVFPIAVGHARELPAPPPRRAPRILRWS